MKFPTHFFKFFFLKSFFILASGTLIAQLIQILSYPFLTRFFTPSDFGIKAFFTTVLVLTTSFSTGKYEEAVPIPQSDQEAVNVVSLSIVLCGMIALIVALFFLLFGNHFFGEKEGYNFVIYVFGVPLGIIAISIINTLSQWAIRKKDFKIMSKVRMIQASAKASFELIGGWLGCSGIILIYGVLIGMSSGFLTYISYFLKQTKKLKLQIRKSFKKETLKNTIYRFINFPKFSIISGLINRMNNHLPILFFTTFSTMDVVGHYSIAVLLVAIPNVIFLESILKIFHSEIAAKLKLDGKQSIDLFFKNVVLVTIVSILLIIGFFFLGKPFLLFAFGDQWNLAGDLIPFYSMTLIGVTWFYISLYVFTLLEKQQTFLYLNFIKLIFLFVGFYICWKMDFLAVQTVGVYAFILISFSAIQLIATYNQLKLNLRNNLENMDK